MQRLVSAPTKTDIKQLIDARIKEYCEQRSEQAASIGGRYENLWKCTEKLLLAGGKRFRPYMLVMTCFAYDSDIAIEDILPAALAQELLHSAMLIHDDIIDRDLIRYGVKNIAGQYRDEYAGLADDATAEHFALSAAILAGDALLSDAHHILRTTNRPDEYVRRAADILTGSIFEVIGGELLDTESAILQPGEVSAEKVALHKTASYSFVGPLTMGGVLAGATMSEVQLLRELSYALGIGYQLRDDLLGVFGNSKQTGKSDSADLREGKRTFLIEQFDMLATDEQKKAFYEIFHRADAKPEEVKTARQLLIDSGAKEAVDVRIATLRDEADSIIEKLSIDASAQHGFYDLVEHCLERTA